MKTSVIFYYEWLHLINTLPDEARLQFYDTIMCAEKRRDFTTDDKHLQAVFSFVANKIAENEIKYQDIVNKRKIAASLGGKQKLANASKRKQVLPKAAYNVNDNDNDNDNDNVNENVNENENKKLLCSLPPDVSPNVWKDYCLLRKKKRAPITETAITAVRKEAAKIGWSLEMALAECCARGWQGFNSEWISKGENKKRTRPSL